LVDGPVRTGGIDRIDRTRGTAVMELFVLLFFALLLVSGVAGLGRDSRDFADWRPSNGGFRDSPRRS
jgi:hypothetical protein